MGRKNLARTSATPGKTRRIHFFAVEGALYLVDLPGFGWARVAREEREAWRPMVEAYLRGERDWSGRELQVTATATADQLAAAAGLLMRKDSGIPAAWIEGVPLEGEGRLRDSLRDPSTDLFR